MAWRDQASALPDAMRLTQVAAMAPRRPLLASVQPQLPVSLLAPLLLAPLLLAPLLMVLQHLKLFAVELVSMRLF